MNLEFTQAFYQFLIGKRASVEAALMFARRRLIADTASHDWASLQLYARSADREEHRLIGPLDAARNLNINSSTLSGSPDLPRSISQLSAAKSPVPFAKHGPHLAVVPQVGSQTDAKHVVLRQRAAVAIIVALAISATTLATWHRYGPKPTAPAVEGPIIMSDSGSPPHKVAAVTETAVDSPAKLRAPTSIASGPEPHIASARNEAESKVYRGTLFDKSSKNMLADVTVHLVGTTCTQKTDKYGNFIFKSCDDEGVQSLKNPVIYVEYKLNTRIIYSCHNIPLLPPPLITSITLNRECEYESAPAKKKNDDFEFP